MKDSTPDENMTTKNTENDNKPDVNNTGNKADKEITDSENHKPAPDGEEKKEPAISNGTTDEIDGPVENKVKMTYTDPDEEIMPITAEDIKIHKEKREKLQKGMDEVDAASIWSYVMEKDFRYYFQHPYLRIFIAYFVTFCNFLIYAEDPVAHSMKECTIPMIGNDFAFVCTRYAPNAWSLLKVVLWLAAIGVGIVVGKMLVHTLLFSKYNF